MTWSQTFTDSHKQEKVFLCTELYRIPKSHIHNNGLVLFDCCVFIARFASLSCYSSAKTRIRPAKSYQINESFCSITRCALLRIVYRLIVVSTLFRCPELQVRPLSSTRHSDFEPAPELEPAFESHFRFFNRAFPSRFCTRYYCTNPSDLQERASPI